MSATKLDLDDITRCPTPRICETCREPADDVAVATVETPIGVACAPLCGSCAERGTLPVWSWPEAALRVVAHCDHLGVDLDEAAAIWRAR